MVLDVARSALEVGRDRLEHALSLELPQDRVGLAAHVVREDVEAPTVRHADDDVAGAVRSRELDRFVEHRHHHVEAFDRELLLAEKRPPQIALEALDLGEPLEKGPLLVGAERLAVRARFDRVTQPEPLLVARDVLELVGQRAAVGLMQLGEGLGQGLGRDVQAEDARWDPGLQLGREPGHEPVRVERRVAGRLRAQWVDVGGQVAVGPMRLDQRHRRRNAPEEQVVGSGGGSAGAGAAAGATAGAPLPPPSRESSRSRSALGRLARTSSGLDSKRARHSGSTDSGEARYWASSSWTKPLLRSSIWSVSTPPPHNSYRAPEAVSFRK